MVKEVLGTGILKMETAEQSKFMTRYMKYYSKTLHAFRDYEAEWELPIEWQMEFGQRLLMEENEEMVNDWLVELWKTSPRFKQQVYDKLQEAQEAVEYFESLKI